LKRIVFITNLNVLGGTENNLVSIVSHPAFKSEFQSNIFSGRPTHTTIAARLSKADIRVIQHNKFMKIRVPPIFRDLVFQKHMEAVKPDIVVFWNHVARSRQLFICRTHQIKTFFFERGTGWSAHEPLAMDNFLSYVDHVLSNSLAGKYILSERWNFQGKCTVLPNAVRPEITNEHFQTKELPQKHPLQIGIAARLVAYKGVASVVMAVNELKKKGIEAELQIAGDGPEIKTLKSLCYKYDVRAFFWGDIRDISNFYRQIHVLICPSVREPFGTVIVEAQAMGCPVICSEVDGLPEVVRHGETGFIIEPTWKIDEYLQFVDHKDNMPAMVYYPRLSKLGAPKALLPGDIAAKVLELIKDPRQYKQMSLAARRFTMENHDFENYIERLKLFFISPPD
jgi:glycosyltransferase involved in cell wall biosynthesis